MPSLALTDALLAAVALWIGFNRQLPVALRLAGAIFSAAAVLGVLRFSGVYPLPTWHQFASMLAAVCAFPLLAVAVVFPDALATRTTRFAWIFMCLMAVLGVLVVAAGQKRLLADALALVSVLAMLLTLARLCHWAGAAGGASRMRTRQLFTNTSSSAKASWSPTLPSSLKTMARRSPPSSKVSSAPWPVNTAGNSPPRCLLVSAD